MQPFRNSPFRWLILRTPVGGCSAVPDLPPSPETFILWASIRLRDYIPRYIFTQKQTWCHGRTVQCEITQVSLQGHHASAFMTPRADRGGMCAFCSSILLLVRYSGYVSASAGVVSSSNNHLIPGHCSFWTGALKKRSRWWACLYPCGNLAVGLEQ